MQTHILSDPKSNTFRCAIDFYLSDIEYNDPSLTNVEILNIKNHLNMQSPTTRNNNVRYFLKYHLNFLKNALIHYHDYKKSCFNNDTKVINLNHQQPNIGMTLVNNMRWLILLKDSPIFQNDVLGTKILNKKLSSINKLINIYGDLQCLIDINNAFHLKIKWHDDNHLIYDS